MDEGGVITDKHKIFVKKCIFTALFDLLPSRKAAFIYSMRFTSIIIQDI